MIQLSTENDDVVIRSKTGALAPRHENQLAYWGFQYDSLSKAFVCRANDSFELIPKVVAYLGRNGLPCNLESGAQALLQKHEDSSLALNAAIERGRRFKDGVLDHEEARDFLEFLDTNVSRPLKEHQRKAALHLFYTRHGANFSVPGSGKTAVVLSVFHRLRQLGEIDSLFVVGPAACFEPWRTEYEAVIGTKPTYEILAGGDIDTRRSKYLVNRSTVCDLFLTTFQTLQRDWEQARVLFEQQDIQFYLVVDEAHYFKQIGGVWASAVLNVAKHASRRCILTGTPFPQRYPDAFNLFDVLWPESSPISANERHRIERHTERKELGEAAEVLDGSIGPLFYRVRKKDLDLAPQIFHDPVRIQMRKYERLVYDSIAGRIRNLSQLDSSHNVDLLFRLRRGRMIRLRQGVSYALLLGSAVTDYKEDLAGEDLSLSDIIRHYDNLEAPAKLDALLSLVNQLRHQNQKIVIWSNFVCVLELLRDKIAALGHGVGLIYGGTPNEHAKIRDELTREKIIQEFVDPESSVDVLVANPSACAESISLHKTCSHAIYYDLSYNCAQYLQSLDRIHRVGGSEHKPAHYHFLQYEDTIDEDILANVRAKAENMRAIIDKDYAVYSLDMFAEDEEIEAYERLFGN